MPETEATNLSVKPPSRFSWKRWSLVAGGVASGVILFLNLLGPLLLQEIVREVAFDAGEAARSGLAVGERAPHWVLSDPEGHRVQLSDFYGSPLVLTFWTTWNVSAADQVKILDGYLSQSDESLFKIVTLNSQEDRSTVTNFMRRGGYQVRVLLDENGAVSQQYRARHLPMSYFLDRNGVIRDVFVGVLSQSRLMEKIEAILR